MKAGSRLAHALLALATLAFACGQTGIEAPLQAAAIAPQPRWPAGCLTTACASDEDCVDGEWCYRLGEVQRCGRPECVAPGGQCGFRVDEDSPAPTMCAEPGRCERCVSVGTPLGRHDYLVCVPRGGVEGQLCCAWSEYRNGGGSCSQPFRCNLALYPPRCASPAPVGSPCGHDDDCQLDTVCNRDTRVCSRAESLTEGTGCFLPSLERVKPCRPGLRCGVPNVNVSAGDPSTCVVYP